MITISPALEAALTRVQSVGPVIAEHAVASEAAGRLVDEVVEALHAAGLFRMLLPEPMGGLGLTIPESLVVYRAVGAIDGSAGWLMAILGNGPLIGRFFDPGVVEGVFGPDRSLLAGSLNPVGCRAAAVDGGFRFTGTATYASGCRHAKWLFTAALVVRDGAPSFPGGRPELIGGVVPIGDVEILDTWKVTGMRATGSNDCTFVDCFVPLERTFAWPDAAVRVPWGGAADHIPMLVQLGGGLAASVVGAARGALDEFVELAGGKRPLGSAGILAERGYAQMAFGEAAGLVTAAEDTLAAAFDEIWERGGRAEAFGDDDLVRLRMRTGTAVRLAKRAVDLVRDAAGMSAVRTPSHLERAWRDVHTGSQHVLLSVSRIEVTGRMLLGLDPGSPLI